MIAGPSATIETGISVDETTTEPNNNIMTQVEEPVKITSQDDEATNYVSSLEEVSPPGSGIYKATVRIKNVREEDFKNFTIRLVSNQVQIEQKIRLRKKSECNSLFYYEFFFG